MKNIRLQSYRCLDDSGIIELKPITYLLGANSAGKSSFLKFFPLLKQSLGVKVDGAFLWTGDDVDFKDFRNTLMDGKDEMKISFTLSDVYIIKRKSSKKCSFPMVELELLVAQDRNGTDFIKQIQIKWGGENPLILKIDCKNQEEVNDVLVNDISLKRQLPVSCKRMFLMMTTGLLPRVGLEYENFITDDFDFIIDKLPQALIHRSNLFILTKSYENLRSRANLESFINIKLNVENFTSNRDVSTINIVGLIVAYYTNVLIDSVNIHLLSLANNIHYVQPLRAITKRYYRMQNYAVSELDSDGTNLPMFLNSIHSRIQEFNDWISPIIKSQFNVRTGDGHVEITYVDENKKEKNLVDIGFGYTQILPILVLIWKVLYMDCPRNSKLASRCKQHIIAIEQPELHLHPRFQSLFTEVLCKAINEAKKAKYDLRIIIDTHSETMINKTGELIAANNIDARDVNVVIFNGLGEKVIPTSYSDDGFIKEWPYGFFEGD